MRRICTCGVGIVLNPTWGQRLLSRFHCSIWARKKRLAQHGASRRCELLWRLGVLRSGIYRSEHREESGTCGLQQWSPKFSGYRRGLKPHRICRILKSYIIIVIIIGIWPGYKMLQFSIPHIPFRGRVSEKVIIKDLVSYENVIAQWIASQKNTNVYCADNMATIQGKLDIIWRQYGWKNVCQNLAYLSALFQQT